MTTLLTLPLSFAQAPAKPSGNINPFSADELHQSQPMDWRNHCHPGVLVYKIFAHVRRQGMIRTADRSDRHRLSHHPGHGLGATWQLVSAGLRRRRPGHHWRRKCMSTGCANRSPDQGPHQPSFRGQHPLFSPVVEQVIQLVIEEKVPVLTSGPETQRLRRVPQGRRGDVIPWWPRSGAVRLDVGRGRGHRRGRKVGGHINRHHDEPGAAGGRRSLDPGDRRGRHR